MDERGSPDSAKLALAIKKDMEDKMELLIYNAKGNFKKIYQTDILLADVPEVRWDDNSNNLVGGDLAINLNN